MNTGIITPQLVKSLCFRAKVLKALRNALDSRGFIEVSTPVRIKAPAAEEYIEAPPAGAFFLRTSPELEMKRLLCAGMDRIYQIGPCFREHEIGRTHRPEFDMLEFYIAHADYRKLLAVMRSILIETAWNVNGTTELNTKNGSVELDTNWDIISVRQAFEIFAGISADEAAKEESRFEQILVEKIEPRLSTDRPTVLIDYPIRFASLARPCASDSSLAERWEVYVGGVELANTYSELTDAKIQRERFQEAQKIRKRLGLADYPEPHQFLDAIENGMPESTGTALGFDRFVMLLAGVNSLDEITFPMEDYQ